MRESQREGKINNKANGKYCFKLEISRQVKTP